MKSRINFDNVDNEFYYFDGKEFQRCLTVNSCDGIMFDAKVADELFYLSGKVVETLVTYNKVRATCNYQLENVNSEMYLLTKDNWELLMTESMNVCSKDIGLIDRVDVQLIRAIEVNPAETTKFINLERRELRLIVNVGVNPADATKINCIEV